MASRRKALIGLGTVGLGAVTLASGQESIFNDNSTNGWESGNIIIRNEDTTSHNITVTLLQPSESKEDCYEPVLERTADCYKLLMEEMIKLKPKETKTIKDAYSSPGVYRVEAATEDENRDTNFRIQLWRENGTVTGMGTEVTILEDGRVTVAGFINAGVGNPPPLNSS